LSFMPNPPMTNDQFLRKEKKYEKEGVALTIEPGVTVKFNDGKALQIQGELIARGSSASGITFTKSGSTNWGYILFEDTSTDADYDSSDNYTSGSIMEYCTVEYVGSSTLGDNGAVRIDDAYPHILYCTVKNNSADGIHAYNLGRKNFTISDCESSENSGSGIYCYDRFDHNNSNFVKIIGCTITNNKSSGHGGGILTDCYSPVNISNCSVTENTSGLNGDVYYENGEGIYAADGSITISDCTVEIDDGEEYEVDTIEMVHEDEGLGLIYGYVYDIDGEPIESVKVTIKGVVSGEKSNEYTDADGFFEFSDVESGTYKLSAKKKGYKKSKETVSVKASQEKYVELELRKSSKSRSDNIEEVEDGAGIGL